MAVLTATPGDGLALSDSNPRTAVLVDGADLLTVTDTADRNPQAGRAPGDTLGLADTPAAVKALSTTATDTLGLHDSGVHAGTAVTGLDLLTLADTTTTSGQAFTATAGDTLHLTDAGALVGKARTGTELLALFDDPAASTSTLFNPRTVGDLLEMSDISGPLLLDIDETVTDLLSFADAVSPTVTGVGYNRNVTDTLEFTDVSPAAVAAARPAVDVLGWTDLVSPLTAGPGTTGIADGLTLTDAVVVDRTVAATVTDVLGIIDATRVKHGPRKRRPGRLIAGTIRGPLIAGNTSGPVPAGV